MQINANTKICCLIKENAAALEAIIGISARFEKLRNPMLRKLMAPRASIAMACRMGACTLADFFSHLRPLGFDIDNSEVPVNNSYKQFPAFLNNLPADLVTQLDVRPLIESGKDPLHLIFMHMKALKSGRVLKILNSFEPTPLMLLLEKHGLNSFSARIDQQTVETFFYKEPGPLAFTKH